MVAYLFNDPLSGRCVRVEGNFAANEGRDLSPDQPGGSGPLHATEQSITKIPCRNTKTIQIKVGPI